jgi:hypothetical protein
MLVAVLKIYFHQLFGTDETFAALIDNATF